MRDQNRQDWENALAGDPVAGQRVSQRVLLAANGSEFAQNRAVEAQLINQASLSSTAVIMIGEASTAQKRLVVPQGKVAFIKELNYRVQANGGGDPTADDLASKLKLEINGENPAMLPEFVLSAYDRGASGVGFGAVPLDLILPAGGNLKLTLTPPNAGTSNFDLYCALSIRLEPLWLAVAAGLVDVRSA